MSYNEILRNSPSMFKEKTHVVFSDIIGETNDTGRLAEFIKETEQHINSELENPTIHNLKYRTQIVNLLNELKHQTEDNKRWLTLIGLLERKIIQLRLYRNINVSYSTQVQKSGINKFNYILLRAPFMDLFKGRKEIRIYYKKLEDFPGFDTIDKLKEDINFKTTAIETVRVEMENWMDKEGITIDYIRDELNKINQIRENHKSKKIVELTLLVSELRKEIKSLK